MGNPYAALFAGAGAGKLTRSIVHADEVAALHSAFWYPLFDDARQSAELRTDLTNEELLDFILLTVVMLLSHGADFDLVDAAARRTYVARFVLPALQIR